MAEFNSTETLEKIRVLLGMIDNTISDNEFIVYLFKMKLAFEELDKMMSNGAGLPTQWQIPLDHDIEIQERRRDEHMKRMERDAEAAIRKDWENEHYQESLEVVIVDHGWDDTPQQPVDFKDYDGIH